MYKHVYTDCGQNARLFNLTAHVEGLRTEESKHAKRKLDKMTKQSTDHKA
jgi:hypothetical protein